VTATPGAEPIVPPRDIRSFASSADLASKIVGEFCEHKVMI